MDRLRIAAALGAARAIPGRLAAARRRAGISQEQLAVILGKTRETINRWERGRVSPSLTESACWAAAVGCTVDVTGDVTPAEGGRA